MGGATLSAWSMRCLENFIALIQFKEIPKLLKG